MTTDRDHSRQFSDAAAPLSAYSRIALKAAIDGKTEKLRTLLALGADPDASNGDHALLHIVTVNMREPLEAVKVLLSAGANIDRRDAAGETALHLALRLGRIDTAFYLLEHGADISLRSHWGDNAVFAACKAGEIGALKKMLDDGADINQESPNEGTLLTAAITKFRIGCVSFLLCRGADFESALPTDSHDPEIVPATPLQTALTFLDIVEKYADDAPAKAASLRAIIKILREEPGRRAAKEIHDGLRQPLSLPNPPLRPK